MYLYDRVVYLLLYRVVYLRVIYWGFTSFEMHTHLESSMQCTWAGSEIVMDMGSGPQDEVRIKDPYEVGQVRGVNAQMVDRVKKVLQGETERIRKGG